MCASDALLQFEWHATFNGFFSVIVNVTFFIYFFVNKYYNLFGILSTVRSMFGIIFIVFKSLENIVMIFFFFMPSMLFADKLFG